MIAVSLMPIAEPAWMHPPIRAALDTYWIVMAVVIGSAINEWLKKRKQAAKSNPVPEEPLVSSPSSRRATGPKHTTEARPVVVSRWEEELGRLLRGESSEPMPEPPVQTHPVHEPVLTSTSRPVVLATLSPPPRIPTALGEGATAATASPYAFRESAASYNRASHLHESIVERLKRIDERTGHHGKPVAIVLRPGVSEEIARTVSLIRDPRTTRQAVITSLIFGPPRSLERD